MTILILRNTNLLNIIISIYMSV